MTGQRYAVLVGSSVFPHDDTLLDLACPANDVDGLNEVLSSDAFGGFTDVQVLKDRPHYEVLRRINQTLKKVGKEDLVLIYFSGHGKLDGAGRLHLATTDTEIADLESTSVPVQSIRNFIDVSPSTKTALILDCCYSGAVGEAFFRSGIDDQLNLAAHGRGTFIMTASTAIQVAKEKEEDTYGIFTKHLIEGIRGGAADQDGDGYVTMNELYTYVHDQVLNESHQEPMKWDLNVRGELIIAKSGTAPWEERRAQVRERLFELASKGLMPDSILAKALEVTSLGRQELNGEARDYSDLLDDLLDKDISTGEFIDQWLKVKQAPPAAPAEPQTEAPSTAAQSEASKPEVPKPRTDTTETRTKQELWPTPPMAAESEQESPVQAAATASHPATPRNQATRELVMALGIWAGMTLLLMMVIMLALDGPDDPLAIGLFSIVGIALGIGLWIWRRFKQSIASLAIHWLGWSAQVAGLIWVTAAAGGEVPHYLIGFGLVAAASGAYLCYWWTKIRPKAMA
ncbi:MAG: caspase family protein [Pseudomonadota bacterium]